MDSLHLVDIIFILLGLTLAIALLAPRIAAPAPVVFASAGILVGAGWHLVPSLPLIHIPPDLVLFIFLPPLLTTAAYALPLQAFWRNLLPIALLAIGLVLATTAIAAVMAHLVLGFGWAAAVILGAILAPPDPVAATSVASKTGLSNRLVVILEGEGLVNDAVAIVIYGIALEALTTGDFKVSQALLMLLKEAPLGVAIGLAVGWVGGALRKRIDRVPLEIGISLITPYLAYHLAYRLEGSAVLAVVALGFMLRASTARVSSPVARLAARTVWSFVRYASEALVFVLLGLLIGEMAVNWPGWAIVRAAVAMALLVILVRMAWMLVVPKRVVPKLEAAFGLARGPTPSFGEQLVLGWAGMRGVVSLVLALALPVNAGGDENTRSAIIFLALVVIVVTLLFQGASLQTVINRLHAGVPGRAGRDEARARALAQRASIIALENSLPAGTGTAADIRTAGDIGTAGEIGTPGTIGPGATVEQRSIHSLIARLESGRLGIARPGTLGDHAEHCSAVMRALDAQRKVVDELRDAGHLSGALAERLDTEIDLDAINAAGDGALLTNAGEE